ncbi:hypothetical protein L208DRAFT_1315752, partial [Tricholoma matsutake]
FFRRLTLFSFVTFFRCLTLFTSTRGRIFLIVIVTPIGSLQDVLWIARWDRGVAIHLVLNLLNLDGGASWSWCWCWFSGWLCCCVHRGPSRRVFVGRCWFHTLLLCF